MTAWTEIVGALEDRLIAVDGRGFRVTPMEPQPALADGAGDEWQPVGQGRNRERRRLAQGASPDGRDALLAHSGGRQAARRRLACARAALAIASCGNAALAAAVIARAAEWPLDVFIPRDADPTVVKRLEALGAAVTVCERRVGRDRRSLRAQFSAGGGRWRDSLRRAGSGQRAGDRRRAHARLRNGGMLCRQCRDAGLLVRPSRRWRAGQRRGPRTSQSPVDFFSCRACRG